MSQHHDPVHPDSDHLTAEVLADLDMGLLDDASAAHARQHLEHCDRCTDLHSDLAQLSRSLRELGSAPSNQQDSEPGSELMPDAVWQRLSDALEAAPALTAGGSAAATVVPIERTRKRRLARPGIGLVAGAAGVALLGAVVASGVLTAGGNSDLATLQNGSAADESERTPRTADFTATRSGTQYREEDLSNQVTQLVAARTALDSEDGAVVGASPSPGGSAQGEATSSPSPGDSKATSDDPDVEGWLTRAGPMATDPAAAQACLEGYLKVSGVVPLAIDIGVWQGKPAAVIVVPLTNDPTFAAVYVIDPACSMTGPQDPLYYYATVIR